MALNQAGLMTLEGIGFALAGAIAEVTGAARAVAVAGGCGLAASAVLLRRDFRRPRDGAAGPGSG